MPPKKGAQATAATAASAVKDASPSANVYGTVYIPPELVGTPVGNLWRDQCGHHSGSAFVSIFRVIELGMLEHERDIASARVQLYDQKAKSGAGAASAVAQAAAEAAAAPLSVEDPRHPCHVLNYRHPALAVSAVVPPFQLQSILVPSTNTVTAAAAGATPMSL